MRFPPKGQCAAAASGYFSPATTQLIGQRSEIPNGDETKKAPRSSCVCFSHPGMKCARGVWWPLFIWCRKLTDNVSPLIFHSHAGRERERPLRNCTFVARRLFYIHIHPIAKSNTVLVVAWLRNNCCWWDEGVCLFLCSGKLHCEWSKHSWEKAPLRCSQIINFGLCTRRVRPAFPLNTHTPAVRVKVHSRKMHPKKAPTPLTPSYVRGERRAVV